MANKDENPVTDALADSRAVEAENAEATAQYAGVTTYEQAQLAGYFGSVTSPIGNDVHMASGEALRAEIFGASPNPETALAQDGPFVVSTEQAADMQPVSNDLATVPSSASPAGLRGANISVPVNTADGTKSTKAGDVDKDAK